MIIRPALPKNQQHLIVGNSGIGTLAITEKTADKLLSSQGITIASLRNQLNSGDPKGLEHFFELPDPAQLTIHMDRETKQGQNIIGIVKSDDPNAHSILIGASYDPIGFSENNPLSNEGHEQKSHQGIDNNVSGTAAVIELATFFAGMEKESPEKIKANLVFCLWSGEKQGWIGSTSFADKLPIEKEKIKACLNFDKIGRLKENRLEIQGLGSAKEWKSIIERKNVVSGFNLKLSDNPYLPSDATSFYIKGIPSANFSTGLDSAYYSRLDAVEKMDFADLQRITKFASLLIGQLMKPEQGLNYQKVEIKSVIEKKSSGLPTLGTIPGYAASDEPGVEIDGIQPGGPAEKAGILPGDRLMKLKGKEVKDIYDFMHILDELTVGVETDIQVKRDGKLLDLKIIPAEKK